MPQEAGKNTTRESRRNATEVALHNFRPTPLMLEDTGPAFDSMLLQKMKICQKEAIDALRDLALMPITSNSSNNMVKFMAASRLAGKTTPDAPPDGAVDTAAYLKQLNEDFAKNAPRIKSVREREYTFEDGSKRRGITVEGEASRPEPLAGQSLPENTG